MLKKLSFLQGITYFIYSCMMHNQNNHITEFYWLILLLFPKLTDERKLLFNREQGRIKLLNPPFEHICAKEIRNENMKLLLFHGEEIHAITSVFMQTNPIAGCTRPKSSRSSACSFSSFTWTTRLNKQKKGVAKWKEQEKTSLIHSR